MFPGLWACWSNYAASRGLGSSRRLLLKSFLAMAFQALSLQVMGVCLFYWRKFQGFYSSPSSDSPLCGRLKMPLKARDGRRENFHLEHNLKKTT